MNNPKHDSLYVKFDQLERLVSEAARTAQAARLPGAAYPAFDALKLIKLIRAEVL